MRALISTYNPMVNVVGKRQKLDEDSYLPLDEKHQLSRGIGGTCKLNKIPVLSITFQYRKNSLSTYTKFSSAGDPDPHVFGRLGSGSISQR